MKLNDALVSDVLEAIVIDRVANKTYFFGLTTSNEITQSVETEKLKAGIGNNTWAILKSSKDMNVSVAYAAASDDLMMLQTGGAFQSKTVSVAMKETVPYATGGAVITGTPKGTAVTVIDAVTGITSAGTFATGKVTVAVAPPTVGTMVHIIYEKELTSQEVLMFKGDEFPKNVELNLHGIAKKDGVVVADIYYVFFNAAIAGNFTRSFQNGAPDPETIEFELAAKAGTNDYGFYTVVPRV